MSPDVNQTPEQLARDQIDQRLRAAGWHVQDKGALDFNAGLGVAVREYQTDIGPADYVLFADRQAVGVVGAKPDSWGVRLTSVEEQSEGYAKAKLKWVSNAEPLPFLYESTGQVTRFTNARDPNPRSREVFTFHRPETLKSWVQAPQSLRAGIAALPGLNPEGLRDCQITAITNLETSLKFDRPRALVQMATGSGKTFTAITQVYRLLKHAGARRILFLVDTKNLGEQAEQEFMAFIPNDDNRKFTELYNVQRLTSPSIANDSQVVISTIQRMYATLKGEELNEGAEDENPAEQKWRRKEPLPVVYNPKLPPEYFDVVVIDECHRSIYNLWRQVIEYFDAYLIGLTALKNGKIVLSEQKNGNWTEDDARPFLVEHDDIFLARGNGSKKLVGIGGRVIERPMPVAFPDTMIRVRLDTSAVRPDFFLLAWNSWTVRSQIEGAARTTAGIYKINQDHVSGFMLPLPSLIEQAEIVRILDEKLEAADTLEAEIDAALTRADALRQSILKKAFSGQLVPQDPGDEPAADLLARIKAERARAAKPPASAKFQRDMMSS